MSLRLRKDFFISISLSRSLKRDIMIEKDALVKIKNTLPREEKSLFSTETNVSAEDQILTLITCNYTIENGRLFIHAVEIKE